MPSLRQIDSKKSTLMHFLKNFFLIIVIGFLFILISFGVLFSIELKQAADKIPNLPKIISEVIRKPTQILSSDDKILYIMSTEYRQPIRIQEVPKVVKDATVAAEDKRFYKHSGIDYFSILRALFVNARVIGGHLGQGGSTLTMQIAKRVYSQNQKTFTRKFQDMALAMMMERELTKDQILELYLNQVYYGSGAYGIKAAAEVYFGKSLKILSISEAATLARLVRRPSSENPIVNMERAISNRNYVLKSMFEENMITEAEYEKALTEKLKIRSKNEFRSEAGMKTAPYFVDYIIEQLKTELPEMDMSEGGYQIHTTLNSKVQIFSEKAIAKALSKYAKRGVTTAGCCVMDKEGRILAMVGGGSYSRNQYNIISKGRRQPGSSFKSFPFAIALETGSLKPNDLLSNERYTWISEDKAQIWSPRNSNNKYGGFLSLQDALAYSSNVAAVRVAEKVGGRKIVHFCNSLFGFKSHLDPFLSLALGCSGVSPLEMMEGYSVFQNEGDRVKPWGLVNVISSDGKIIKQFYPTIKKGVLSQNTSKWIDSYLRAAVIYGTGKAAAGVLNARGKTGTTNEFIDVSFYGYTDKLLGGVWAANEVPGTGKHRWNYKPMGSIYGGTVPAQIWAELMQPSQKIIGEKSRFFVNPSSEINSQDSIVEKNINEPNSSPKILEQKKEITEVKEEKENEPKDSINIEICAETGQKANVYCPTVILNNYSIDSVPQEQCHIHKKS